MASDKALCPVCVAEFAAAVLRSLRDRWAKEKSFLPDYHALKLKRLDALCRLRERSVEAKKKATGAHRPA